MAVVVPTYTTPEAISSLLQITIDADSSPSISHVRDRIEEVSAWMDEKRLGVYTSTDELIDVSHPPYTASPSYAHTPRITNPAFSTVVVYTKYFPILSVLKLEKNDQPLTSTPIWAPLTEGPSPNSSFVVDRIRGYGVAIRFYNDPPRQGSKRVRATYTYGYNYPSYLMREYATKKVSLAVLEQKAAVSSLGVDLKTGPWAALYQTLSARCKELEDYFAKNEVPSSATQPVALL